MRILGIFSAFRPVGYGAPVGGGEISNRQLLGELANRGHDVTVYAFNAGAGEGRAARTVRVLDGGLGHPGSALEKIVRAARARRNLSAALDGFLPDVILTGVGTVGVGIELSKRCGAPVAVLIRALRDMQPPAVSPAKRMARHLVYGSSRWKNAPYLIANSQFLLDRCRQDGFKGRGWVVYPPVDVEIANADWPSAVRTIGMVGSSSQKGIETFLALASAMPEVSFKVIGDRSVPPGEVTSSNNLTRVGWTNDPAAEIDTCDALLMPSKIGEAFGRTAVEAIRRKKFVLASTMGGLPEAVAHRSLLIDPMNFEAWREQVSRLVRDPGAFVPAMRNALEVAKSFDLMGQTGRLEAAIYGIAGQSVAYQ